MRSEKQDYASKERRNLRLTWCAIEIARICCGCVLIGDDGFEVSPLPPLLPAVAIGGCRGDTGHLFPFVDYGLFDITSIHHSVAVGPQRR